MSENCKATLLQQMDAEIACRLRVDACAAGKPKLALVIGPVCSGKTTMRREQFADAYVVVDAAQLFIDLGGRKLDFPSVLEQAMEYIGSEVARRAVLQRMNIVTELLGADFEPVKELIDAMTAVGYSVEIVAVTADLQTCIDREATRTEDNISSYYAERYQRKWLIDATR
jgi:hypothetical protein